MASLEIKRHSLEHVMVLAIRRLFGTEILLGVGPVIEKGFYQDFDYKFTTEDFAKIEAEMLKIISEDIQVKRELLDIDAAISLFKQAGQKFKVELLEDIKAKGTSKVSSSAAEVGEAADLLKEGKVSIYTIDIHQDLCRGPHVDRTSELKAMAFKLDRIAGAYWRGSEKNPMLTRIYAVAFESQAELDEYYALVEEAKKRDHRKLGVELDLFAFSDLVGSGLPLFTPNGTILREELNQFSQSLRLRKGFQKVWVPHITKNDLYKVSGHWAKFGDELFLVKSQETDDQMVMKPMNCPHHQQIYASRKRSYKDLPIRYLETTTIYRDEKAGELLGLSRVRSVTQDDSHLFCTPEQIESEYQVLIDIVREFYATIGMKYRARLSFRDPNKPEKYLGDVALWDKAQVILLDIAKNNKLDYYVAEGEAAFYGPKIDFMVQDALGREWQLGTPQLDFVQPQRFGLTYTDSDGQEKTPVMIHFALLGSIERFLSVYIEHTAGNFPTWMAPVQVKILPISQDQVSYCEQVAAELQAEAGERITLRIEIDRRDETLQAKIRDAAGLKIPYTLICGKREAQNNQVAVRVRSQGDKGVMSIPDFAGKLVQGIIHKDIDPTV